MTGEENPVLLTIVSRDDDGDEITLKTRATLSVTGEIFCLRYEEADADGVEQIYTQLFCEPERVTLTRLGGVATTLVFARGEPFLSSYRTPFGAFSISIFTLEANCRRRGRMGGVDVTYQTDLGDEVLMRRLKLRFKPCAD